eukprot:15364678-Ditylum_brightwellii.AAC.1
MEYDILTGIYLTTNKWLQYFNNKTAVGGMRWHNLQNILNPAAMTQPDFDVQLQIGQVLKSFLYTWAHHHVKSHQTGPNLSWEAQLNTVADTLATKEKLEILHIIAKKHKCTYPEVHIHLTINKTSISREYLHKILEAYMSTVLVQPLESGSCVTAREHISPIPGGDCPGFPYYLLNINKMISDSFKIHLDK